MPLSWHAVLNDLVPLLATLYPSPDGARLLVLKAGLDPVELDLSGAPKTIWLRILEEANRREAVPQLLRIAQTDYPNIDFDTMQRQLDQGRIPPAPDVTVRQGGTEGAQLEKVSGHQPTLLPIR